MDKGLVSEKDLEKAISNARVNQIDVAKVLEEDFNVPKGEVLGALSLFYNCPPWVPGEEPMPVWVFVLVFLGFGERTGPNIGSDHRRCSNPRRGFQE